MKCPCCKDTGIVTEVYSSWGEPPDYEAVLCPCCYDLSDLEPELV
jgi:hypothetical protein